MFKNEYVITIRPEHFEQARELKNKLEREGKYWSVCENCPVSLALDEQTDIGFPYKWFTTFDGHGRLLYGQGRNLTNDMYQIDSVGKFVINEFDSDRDLDDNVVVTLIRTENVLA